MFELLPTVFVNGEPGEGVRFPGADIEYPSTMVMPLTLNSVA